ncbi:MAG TPA: GNAT family N-acetyltransferase [Gemmatimonadales bacterium]|nr:GNAT family N-acetyltransferase [Gemmatimonadales bacterium]
MTAANVTIRPATGGDRDWILGHAPHLHDFGPPPYRPREVMDRAVVASIDGALSGAAPGAEVLVAVGEGGERLGFIHLHGATDFFTGERHGHVSDIVVAPEARGRGVGEALMTAAEGWARSRGYRLLSLHVFDGNTGARAFYARLGYQADVRKLVKPLD